MIRISLAMLFLSLSHLTAAEREVSITPPGRLLPKPEAVVVVKSGEPGPGQAKHQAVASINDLKMNFKLADGVYDFWWKPKGGKPMKFATKVTVDEKGPKSVDATKTLGVIELRGDNQPRADLITLTVVKEPGPDEKGHVAIQTAKDYREEMVAPDGFYDVWVTPTNGARPRLIAERVKIQAGKTTTLD
jgi:hypothetical protein